MRFQPSRRQGTLSFPAALALLALAAPTTSQAVAPTPQAALDYSKNSVSGEYAPAVPRTVETATTTDNPGFDWGAAAIGAGAAITLLLLGSVAALALIERGRVRLAR
jgi:hypothetical protein